MSIDSLVQRLGAFITLILAILATGFVFQMPWATSIWLWREGRLSFIFIGSIIFAVVAALAWIVYAREWGALAAVALTVLVALGGMTIYFLPLAISGASLKFGLAFFGALLLALAAVALFVWSRGIPIRDERPTPRLVRISFGIFVAALLLSGSALIFQVPNVMPWSITSGSSTLFGWIFIGDACYFLYGLIYPRWHNARAQLWSFFVYDIVLLPPLLALLGNIRLESQVNLYFYLLVLIYSASVAVYYLFLDKTTRTTFVARTT